MNCQVKDCKRSCQYKKYEYCNLHYQRWRRLGDSGTSTEGQIRDGHVKNYAYKSWTAMKTRCLNSKSDAYHNYGGRGITVCDKWLDFYGFLEDMGERPKGRSLERINTNGNYEPGNCVWADRQQQNNNKRNNLLVTIGKDTKTPAEWASISGIEYSTIIQRIHRGWSGEYLLIPDDARYKHKILTPNGLMTVKELSKNYNIKPYLIYQRIKRGLKFNDIIKPRYSL